MTTTTETPIAPELIASRNQSLASELERDYASLGERLERRGVDIERVTERVGRLALALPTWGVGTGGTRFARFPAPGEPRDPYEKIEDCGVVHQLGRVTPTCSPHFPWDRVDDYAALRDHVSFYPGRIACTVAGERVRPQAGGFYGGWITDDVVGPFKGDPGTEGW